MKVPLHLVEQRREKLRELIRHDGFLPVAEICRRLGISEATARRDLATVAGRGEITRTRGGALADYNSSFASVDERESLARTAKGRVANRAVKELADARVVFLDAGTTIQAVARRLCEQPRKRELVVVTNSLVVASVLGGVPGIELHVLGGVFLHRQSLLLGPNAIAALRPWSFDAACLGGEGVDERGISNSHRDIAVFQAEVMARSTRTLYCLDASKVGRGTPNLVCGWDQPWELVSDVGAHDLRSPLLSSHKTRIKKA